MDRLSFKEKVAMFEGRINELLDKIVSMQEMSRNTKMIEKTLYTNLKVLKAFDPHNVLLGRFMKDHPKYVF